MDQSGNSEDTLITIAPSTGRRWIGILALAGLGVLLLSLVFEATGGLWRLLFLGFSVLAFLAADRLRIATDDSIVLTRTELRTGKGHLLTPVSNVKGVERGALAFKPSNGFLVRLHEPQGKGWAPGLYWQRGRLLGIGGVIPGGQSRAMAEILAALIQGVLPERDD